MVDPHRGVHRDLHAAARHHDRERRAARRSSATCASSFTDLQWVIDAYALTLAALLLTGGSLADLFGRRRDLRDRARDLHRRLGAVRARRDAAGPQPRARRCRASAARSCSRPRWRCSPRPSRAATAAPRSGSGARPPARRSRSARWSAACSPTASAGRRSSSSTCPIGIAAIAMTLAQVEESQRPERRAASTGPAWSRSRAALFALIFALIRGNAEGWGGPLIVGCLAAAVVLGIAFVLVERRSAHPMLDLSLFRKPAFAGASIAAFVLSASMFSMFLYLTLYIQNILGYSPLESGLRFLPVTLLSFLVAPISGKFAERLGIRWFLGAGLALRRPRAAADERARARRRLDRAARRLPRRRRRHRARQPAARHRRGRRRRAAARRDGVRDQLDLPAGRHRHRHRRRSARSSSTSWPRTSSRACPRARPAAGRPRAMRSRTSSPSAARSRSATARCPGRPSRRSSTGSTTSSSTPRSSPSSARCWRPC